VKKNRTVLGDAFTGNLGIERGRSPKKQGGLIEWGRKKFGGAAVHVGRGIGERVSFPKSEGGGRQESPIKNVVHLEKATPPKGGVS